MDPSFDDFRFAVAEVSVAFAGFAGLVTVITQRLAPVQRDFDVVRFRDMLLLSLMAAGFALLPTLPLGFGASDAVAWRLSAALFLLGWIGFAVQGLLAGYRLSRSGSRPFSRPLFWSNLAVHAPAMVALTMVAADSGIVSDVRAAVYVSALFAILYLAGAYFVALFVSLARG